MITSNRVRLFTVLILTTVFTLILYGCSQKTSSKTVSLDQKSELVVAIDIDIPGYFVVNDESFGYQYDLLKAYADDLGLELRVIPEATPSEYGHLLKNGEVDFVATLAKEGEDREQTTEIYSTSYVVMGTPEHIRRTWSTRESLWEMMNGRRVLISSGFQLSKDYQWLLDTLSSTHVFISSRSSLEMMKQLREGSYDYFICEKSEAQLGSTLIKGLNQLYEFESELGVHVAITPNVKGLHSDFEGWLEGYKTGEEYRWLRTLYLERGIAGQMARIAPNQRIRNGISIYDDVMREVCKVEGFDWRLMSAIAYSESRFNPDVVSHRGARGLMQIMPATARQFNVPQHDVMKPEVNILVATKLLGEIERMLRFPDGISNEDRMSLILASYNCGIGHVLDARRLTKKYGGNPNLWSDVSLYLQRKAESHYNSDEVVRNGRFSGSRQTLAFVSDVMGRYSSYCAANKLN